MIGFWLFPSPLLPRVLCDCALALASLHPEHVAEASAAVKGVTPGTRGRAACFQPRLFGELKFSSRCFGRPGDAVLCLVGASDGFGELGVPGPGVPALATGEWGVDVCEASVLSRGPERADPAARPGQVGRECRSRTPRSLLAEPRMVAEHRGTNPRGSVPFLCPCWLLQPQPQPQPHPF